VSAWTWKTKPDPYRQVHKGLERYRDWIRQRPTIVTGDLNDNKSFRNTAWGAFHGAKKNPFHIDYCFVPKEGSTSTISGTWSLTSLHSEYAGTSTLAMRDSHYQRSEWQEPTVEQEGSGQV
jgi:hypothetical protein